MTQRLVFPVLPINPADEQSVENYIRDHAPARQTRRIERRTAQHSGVAQAATAIHAELDAVDPVGGDS